MANTQLYPAGRGQEERGTSRKTNNTTRCPLPQDCPVPECKSLHAGFGCNVEPESFATHLYKKKNYSLLEGAVSFT